MICSGKLQDVRERFKDGVKKNNKKVDGSEDKKETLEFEHEVFIA